MPENLDRPDNVSDQLWSGVLAKVRRMEQQELSFYRHIQPLFEQLFPTYLQQLRSQFYGVFSPLLTQAGVAPVFDLQVATQTKLPDAWADDLDAMLTAVEDEWVEEMEDQLVEAHDDGWFFALWLIDSQDGEALVDEDVADLVPDSNLTLPFLIAGGFAGLSFLQRATAWRQQAVEKLRQQVKAHAAMGVPWTEVEPMLKRVLKQYQDGLAALGADELYLARIKGEEHAVSGIAAGGYTLHLWLTREDEKVCAVCEPLHLTLTDLRPITDTHPRCRCVTFPFLDTATPGNRTTFEAFVRRLRGTPPVAAF